MLDSCPFTSYGHERVSANPPVYVLFFGLMGDIHTYNASSHDQVAITGSLDGEPSTLAVSYCHIPANYI